MRRKKLIIAVAVIAVTGIGGVFAQRKVDGFIASLHAKDDAKWQDVLVRERKDIALKIDEGERHLREKANKAQEAILSEYVATYCADHSGESSGERQMAMLLEAMLSRMAIASGVDQIGLAEYNKCKPPPEDKLIEPHRLRFPPNWKG
jgi:hypothetical protein